MAEKINLDTLVSSTLHSHYYAKVDGTEAGNAKYVKQIERDKGYYTSPRNIRKLFLKNSGIEVVYYRPIVGKKDLVESISYSQADTNLIIRAFKEFAMEYSGQLPANVNRVTITGTGFNTFLSDLSVSNLEELYFDWSLLLGNKELFGEFVRFGGKGIVGVSVQKEEVYTEPDSSRKQKVAYVKAETLEGSVWDNIPGSRELASKMMGYITTCMCGSRRGGLPSNYPRLKYIGFIGDSKLHISTEGGITKDVLKAYDKRAMYNFCQPKQLNAHFGNGTAGIFKYSMFVDTGIDFFSTGFRVDTGLYQFDADILEDYFKCTSIRELTKEIELTKWFTVGMDTKLGLESKLWWVKQLRAGELVGQKSAKKSLEKVTDKLDKKEVTQEEKQVELDSKPRSSLESTWNAIYKRDGVEQLKFIINCLRMQMDSSVLIEKISEFSPAGKEFYMKLFNSLD